MKKTLVGAILGIATAASVFGQGQIFFNNYDVNTDAVIKYGAGTGGAVGAGVNDTFTAGLYYAFGAVSWTDSTGIDNPALYGFTLSTATQGVNAGVTASLPGYFAGPIITIPGYTSGDITFVVVAYNGANYSVATERGHSAAFTMSGIATGSTPAGEFGAGLQSFNVLPTAIVPEPSTFALAGLGLASLLIFRRRK